jgi:hypothetical protein
MSSLLAPALAGGFIGTVVMTTMLRAASEASITRMDLPFLLGTAFSDRRRKAKVWGYAIHFIIGLLFALGYAAAFDAVGYAGWRLGALLGIVHASFVATALVNVLLPIVHPRIGTPETGANEVALLEPPGFMMLNYGRNTFLVTLAAHAAYGAIVGWACANMA